MFPIAGCGDETAGGIPLDEQTEMELALFMSLQNQEHVWPQAPATASESESAESVPESESESEAESAESESTEATSGAESVVMPAAAQAESAAMAAAAQAESAAVAAASHPESAAMAASAQAESAAMAAAAQAETAATAAVAQAESAANAAVAQAESAATAAAAHATAAASTVAAHVEAAARSVDAALNHRAASVWGTVLSFADHLDGWWLRRPRPPQRGPQQEGQQQRGPQQRGLPHRGPQQAEVQQRGPQQVGVQQRGPQSDGQAAHSPAPAPGGQAMADGIGSAALSVAPSDPVHQEEEVAEVAESLEQRHRSAADATPVAMRFHSVSSDDSSFGSPAAPASALPIDQFAALSLLDFDSVVPNFEDTPAVPDVDDSPFDVHSEDQEGAASSHISIGHADQAMTDAGHDAGQVVPVIPWDATSADQDVRHNAEQVQDDAPVSYPRIDTSPFSASFSGSESPVHYPEVHRPTIQQPSTDYRHQVHQPSSPRNMGQLPSPRTQMHLSALGSGAFSCQSSVSGDEAQHIGEYDGGDMTPAGVPAGWPLDASTGGSAAWPLNVEEPAEAAASIHVHQGQLCAMLQGIDFIVAYTLHIGWSLPHCCALLV